jgi:chromosome segregation ATPase
MSLDTSIPPQLSALASISAIAQRIQEKADALNSERNVLQDLQNQLQTLTQQQALQSSKNEALKYDLLKQTRSKIGLEIEIMRRDDRMRELKRKIVSQEKEMDDLQQEIQRVKEESARDQEMFTPHFVKIELFQRQLEGDLNERREKRRKREQQLDSFVSERERNLEFAMDLKRDQERAETEIEVMRQVEVAEDEEIAALAMQIRATLSKRTSLRSALEDARKRNKEANLTMVKWEEECMKFSNRRVL